MKAFWSGDGSKIAPALVARLRRRLDALNAAAPAHAPTHPGAVLREDVLPALRLSVTEAAEKLGISRQALHAVLSERASVTAEMAVRLGKLCGNGPGLWLRMQTTRDLWHAERAMKDVVASIPTLQVV